MTTTNSVDNDGVANPIFLSDSHKEKLTIPCIPGLESDKAKVNLEEPKKKEDNVWTNTLRGKWVTLQKTHIMPLIVSICIMVVIFQIPLILYCTDPPSTDVTSLLDSVDFETCSVNSQETLQASVSTLLISLCNESNPADGYLHLLTLQAVYELSVVLENGQCSDTISQFYCNAIDDDSHDLITECLEVRDDTCAAEWRMVESFTDLTLPSCDGFYGANNFTSEKAPALNCPADFSIFCGSLCQPLCAEFSLFSDAATIAYKVLNIMFHVMAIIAGVVTILACYIHRKKMFSFPQIFVVYNTVILELISIFVIFPHIFGTDELLCSHPNLNVAITKPTAFCGIQGFVFQSGTLMFFGFWIFHLVHLLHSLISPVRSQLLMKSKRFRRVAHLIEVVIISVCGLLPSIVIVSTSGYQFIGFPPICSNEIPDVFFYTLIFPMSIEATVGLCMLLVSLWLLHKNYKFLTKKKTGYSTPETKLIILFSYYGITITLVLIRFMAILLITDNISENLYNFMLCSAGGHRVECDRYREEVNDDLIPFIVFDVISFFFIAFANIINLLYILQYKDVKDVFQKILTFTSFEKSEL